MEVIEKIQALSNATCAMQSSLELVLADVHSLVVAERMVDADKRLEKAAQYAWGFNRPDNW